MSGFRVVMLVVVALVGLVSLFAQLWLTAAAMGFLLLAQVVDYPRIRRERAAQAKRDGLAPRDGR